MFDSHDGQTSCGEGQSKELVVESRGGLAWSLNRREGAWIQISGFTYHMVQAVWGEWERAEQLMGGAVVVVKVYWQSGGSQREGIKRKRKSRSRGEMGGRKRRERTNRVSHKELIGGYLWDLVTWLTFVVSCSMAGAKSAPTSLSEALLWSPANETCSTWDGEGGGAHGPRWAWAMQAGSTPLAPLHCS